MNNWDSIYEIFNTLKNTAIAVVENMPEGDNNERLHVLQGIRGLPYVVALSLAFQDMEDSVTTADIWRFSAVAEGYCAALVDAEVNLLLPRD